MDCDTGKSEGPVLASIAGCVTNNYFVMPLQVLGEDIRIQEKLGYLERVGRTAGTAPLRISEVNHFVQQLGIFRTAKQPKPLFKDRCFGLVHARGTVPVKPCVELRQFLRLQAVNGEFDVL